MYFNINTLPVNFVCLRHKSPTQFSLFLINKFKTPINAYLHASFVAPINTIDFSEYRSSRNVLTHGITAKWVLTLSTSHFFLYCIATVLLLQLLCMPWLYLFDNLKTSIHMFLGFIPLKYIGLERMYKTKMHFWHSAHSLELYFTLL